MTEAPVIVSLGLDDIATGEVCDRHPAARAEYRSPEYGLTFCGHCARYGVARVLALVPTSARPHGPAAPRM